MGAWIDFAETAPNHWGVEHPDSSCAWRETVPLSAFTAERQSRAYGLSWEDCLAWIAEDGEAAFGPREGREGPEVWYQPDWPLALARTRELMAKIAVAPEGHRKAYDSSRMPAFAAAVERCAGRPGSSWVRWSY